MKRLTKCIATIGAIALTLPTIARANDQTCGPNRLNGLYVFSATGYNIDNGTAVPKAIVEQIEFNGDGTLDVPAVTVSINGNLIRGRPGSSGTYQLGATPDPLCVGTVKFSDGNQFDLFVSPHGDEAWMIQTNAVLPTGPTRAVLQGKLERVTH